MEQFHAADPEKHTQYCWKRHQGAKINISDLMIIYMKLNDMVVAKILYLSVIVMIHLSVY